MPSMPKPWDAGTRRPDAIGVGTAGERYRLVICESVIGLARNRRLAFGQCCCHGEQGEECGERQ